MRTARVLTVRISVATRCQYLWWAVVYSEAQCNMGNGHMGHPAPVNRMKDRHDRNVANLNLTK